jgi:uncharacterized membrane protein HdeD (DUF308 family)/uncharacterized membrane protein YjdF
VRSPRTWDWPRIVYGDWTWYVRDSLDVLRLAFIGGTIVFAAEGRSDVVALAAASTVLLIARVINLPRWFDFGLTVAMTLIAWGTALSLYGHWFYYDKVVHSLSPVAYAPVLYIALVRLGVVPDPGVAIKERRVARIAGIFIVTLALGMAVGAGYESIEWFEDKFDILGGHFVKGLWDTETDLLADTTGSLIGATFLTVWATRGWSSRRTTVVPAPMPSTTPIRMAEQRIAGESHLAGWRARIGELPTAAQGAAALIAGVILLALPGPSLRTVGIIVGIALLLFAAFEVVDTAWRRHRLDPSTKAISTVEIVGAAAAGAIVLAWPTITQLALVYAVGASAVVVGVAEAAALSNSTDVRERWLGAVSAVLALAFGLTLLARPHSAFDKVITLLGLYLVVIGGLRLVRALAARRSAKDAPR